MLLSWILDAIQLKDFSLNHFGVFCVCCWWGKHPTGIMAFLQDIQLAQLLMSFFGCPWSPVRENKERSVSWLFRLAVLPFWKETSTIPLVPRIPPWVDGEEWGGTAIPLLPTSGISSSWGQWTALLRDLYPQRSISHLGNMMYFVWQMWQGQGEAGRVVGSRAVSKYVWGREFSALQENAGVQGRRVG